MAICWNLEELLMEADAFDVADAIGITKKHSGNSVFIPCVFGIHKETHINHMQLFRDGCKCYSCGESCNTYGMVKAYYQNIVGVSLNHDEICTIIADTCGGTERFIIKKDKNKEKTKSFPLSKEELEIIGLNVKTPRARQIISYSEDKDEKHRETVDCNGYAQTSLLPAINIYSFFKDDETIFWMLVEGKISEKMFNIKKEYAEIKNNNDICSKEMVQFYKDLYSKLLVMQKKYFPKKCVA